MTADARAITLLYHDIYSTSPAESGFSGAGADRYKLASAAFLRHLDAIGAAQPEKPTSVLERSGRPTFHLAFDDGGSSSLAIADALDARGWIGHFFPATDFIGNAGFVGVSEIRELARRGHVVGSHSCSHPACMADEAPATLVREWRDSAARLADILGSAVVTGSIPCGSYARHVAEAAGDAGITHLFTSEPTWRTWSLGPVTLYGRFSIVDTTAPAEAAALARGDAAAAARQLVAWRAKATVRRAVGSLWNVARDRLLIRRRRA